MGTYAIKRTLKAPFDAVLAKLPDALKAEGFGILTEIDVKETMKRKLNVELRRYRIFGACNPPFAHRALEAELDIGVMLPCNVILYEADNGDTVVAAIDPERTMVAVANPALETVAREIGQRLRRVVAAL
jgi:uncharacterized protein (DUF302 family)